MAVETFEAGQTAAQVTARYVVAERLRSEHLSRLVERPVGFLQTFGSVATGLRDGLAFINVLFAVFTFVAWMALAQVILDEVDAVGAVDARGALAIVDVDFAMDAVKSSVVTVALVRIDSVQAQSVVKTR